MEASQWRQGLKRIRSFLGDGERYHEFLALMMPTKIAEPVFVNREPATVAVSFCQSAFILDLHDGRFATEFFSMTFRGTQQESRARCLATYDAEEASKYDAWITAMTSADHDACVADLKRRVAFFDNMTVLDAGSGTGALCLALIRISGLRITALEPCPAMTRLFEAKPELKQIPTIQGFCDNAGDKSHFAPGSFDLIASRQVANGLFDPLAAFRNWHAWLRPGGSVVVMDGLFDRDAWSGEWDGVVDTLPLSACRTTATVPYLLEQCGFHIDSVGLMDNTNALPSTRTQRFMVVATKKDG